MHTEHRDQASFCPFALREVSVLAELALGHLRYSLTDVPPQSNSPPGSVLESDIIDVHLKKFIEVKVSNSFDLSLLHYQEKKIGMGGNTALCVVNPRNGDCRWIDHDGNIKGERKVVSFLLSRYEVMRQLGIVDTEIQEQRDLVGYVLPDTVFNNMRNEWVKDWYPIEISDSMNKIFREGNKRTIGIKPSDMLENLTNLQEENRTEIVKWRGKLIPEGWTYNLLELAATDNEMISIVFSFISEQSWEYIKFHEKSVEKPELINTLINIWEDSDNKNFSLVMKDTPQNDIVKDMLGIGAKRRRHCQSDESTTQPEPKPLQNHYYHSYFDEIIREMNKKHGIEGKPMLHLLDDLPDSNHPIAKIGIGATKMLIENITENNSALYSSRLTNLYSRLGGSYLITKDNGKTNHGDTAMMPIYATIRNEITREKRRAITGIVMRGPQHARSPTDKIQFITVEIMENTPRNRFFLKTQQKHDVWYNHTFLIAVRTNSIMKEDTAFITFNQNSFFVPANLLGVMTMENKNVAPNIDMEAFVKGFLRENIQWFAERFTEGVLMSAIGNSRDEGYFAQLRKMFMLLLAYRREKRRANWDIVKFCEKANECLIDNPFGMHFHLTVIKILKQYDKEYKDMGNQL